MPKILLNSVLFILSGILLYANQSHNEIDITELADEQGISRDTLNSIENIYMICTHKQNEMDIRNEIYIKGPEKSRIITTVANSSYTTIINGKQAIRIDAGKIENIPLPELIQQKQQYLSYVINPLLDIPDNVKLKDCGVSIVDGVTVKCVSYELESGYTNEIYIDTKTKNVVKSVLSFIDKTGKTELVTKYYDYQMFGKYRISSRQRFTLLCEDINNPLHNESWTISILEFLTDKPIVDEAFTIPKKKATSGTK